MPYSLFSKEIWLVIIHDMRAIGWADAALKLTVNVALFLTRVFHVLQLCCAVAINLCGGRTKDGGKVYGASVFYSDSGNGSASSNEPPTDEVNRLEQELQVMCLKGKHGDTYAGCLLSLLLLHLHAESAESLFGDRRSFYRFASCKLVNYQLKLLRGKQM
jgi:hypothetical protein